MTSIQSRATMILAAALGTMLVSAFVLQSAYANPYNAGYITGSATSKSSFQMKTDILNAASGRESWIASVASAAGFATSTSSTPTGWQYQTASRLNTDNTISAVYNVRTPNGVCASGGCASAALGTYGTDPNDTDYTYMNMIWSSSSLGFYYEEYENDGDINWLPMQIWDAAAKGDPSRKFRIGTISADNDSSGCTGVKTFKLFQFGVESFATVTKDWKIKQYDIMADGTSLSTNTAKSTKGGSCTSSLISWITYRTNSDGTINGAAVGPDAYSNVNAKYNKNDATVPDGQVHWYRDSSSTTIGQGVTLWP